VKRSNTTPEHYTRRWFSTIRALTCQSNAESPFGITRITPGERLPASRTAALRALGDLC
jgi:hypothetical protein